MVGIVQIFDNGAGSKILSGGAIYDESGNLLHVIDQNALGITYKLLQSTWITGNVYAGIDEGTSTVIVYKVGP